MEGRTQEGPDAPRTQTRTIPGQLLQQPTPLLPEDVGPSEAPVPADHAQVGDAQPDQVVSCAQAPFPSTEGFAPGAADDGPSLGKK